MHRIIRYVLLAAVLASSPGTAIAQDAEPLQKSDIIRLLTGTTYSKAEVAGIIRQSCLSFTPTERDLSDFRALGADEAVMAAIDRCSGGPAVAPVGLQLSMDRRVFDVTVGDTARIPAGVRRADAVEGGLRLQLVGSGALTGGSDARAVTAANGQATFVFPVGTRAGRFNLTVEAAEPLGGSRAVTVRVRAGSPAQAVATPDPVALSPDGTIAPLQVVVRDRYGNPVGDAPVEVRSGSEDGPSIVSGRTSAAGVLDLSVDESMVGGANRLVYLSGGSALGASGVARPAGAVAAIAAISGEGQGADPGQDLAAPLVVAVVDASGAPARNVEIRFSASNGQVDPETARTDDRGRASVVVTTGPQGRETTVTARAGDAIQVYVFPITRGGMTVAAMEGALMQAAGLVAAGDPVGARDLYVQVVEADPSNLAARTGVADTYAAEGRYEEAVDGYRAVLRQEPSRRGAQVGMARASLGAGDAAEAARWFDLALSQDRTDVASWVGVGTARARLGQQDDARAAFERALALDPGNEDAMRGLDRLNLDPLLLEVDVWGGYTSDNGRDPGFRWAELRLNPGAGFEFWAAFDNALNFRHPYLVRGQDDIEGYFGGLGYSYGTNRAYRTSFEIGRRKEPVGGTIQTTWTLDQTFGFGSGGWFKIGGWLGHWYFRDDWVVFAETGIPAGSSVVVKPMVSYGDYFGSGLTEVPVGVPTLASAKDLRVGLAARYESASGFGMEPAVFYGNVDSEASEELTGSLWDGSMRLWYSVSRTFAIDSFVQYQTPPGLPSFWRVGLGLRFGVEHSY